jgi:hypothetical protein
LGHNEAQRSRYLIKVLKKMMAMEKLSWESHSQKDPSPSSTAVNVLLVV